MLFLQAWNAILSVCCNIFHWLLSLWPLGQRIPPGKASSPGVHVAIRLARHRDYNAVMRISEALLYGTDYLRAKFHSFIDAPDVTVFLAEVGHKVVAVKASKIVDSGTVSITKASRVAPEWREQGIDRKMTLYLDQWIRKNRPRVKYKRSVTYANGRRAETLRKRMRHVFSVPFIVNHCGPSLWWRQDPAQLAQLDTTGLPDVVPLQTADDDFCTALQKWLPSEACAGYHGKPIILIERDPYILCPANSNRLQARAHNALYTLKHEGEWSLSVVDTYPAQCGRMLSLDIYAKDFLTLQKHLLKHLHDLSIRFRHEHICTRVFVGLSELKDQVQNFCEEVLQMDASHLPFSEMGVFECEL
ncbi:uncharacterized protein LOC118428279 [Branchiostoma floridae]|uniref:Uncharacterized protein LOC118428279 n=1 Tax=Branchiostoma floridae TaxID=7739 RepID=A0A9J7N8X2_BRAFL|nr:uncharacterized protein LOC118428279 [Branchiostoma floridae]